MWVMGTVFIVAFLFLALEICKNKKKTKEIHGLNTELSEAKRKNNELQFRNDLLKQVKSLNDHYIVELNKGTYLSNRTSHVGGDGIVSLTTEHYAYTRDIREATTFMYKKDAKRYAEKCGGQVLHNKPVLEVVG